jgi:hypothetical protein
MSRNGNTSKLESPPSRPVALSTPDPLAATAHNDLEAIDQLYRLNEEFEKQFRHTLKPEPALSRQMVSFQANKARAVYRWYK